MKSLYKLIKYGFFGATTAAIEFVAFLIFNELVHIYIASTISFVIGLVTSFLFNKFIVFKNSKKVSRAEVLQFASLGIINSQLSSVITWGLSLVITPLVSKIITMALIAVWNYVIMNLVIFKDKSKN